MFSFKQFSRVVLIVISLNFSGLVWADTKPVSPGFNDNLLEMYIDRASTSKQRTRWLRIAQAGLDMVLAEWEAAAILVFSDDEKREEKKATVQAALRERLTKGLVEWTVQRFSERSFGDGLSEYWTSVSEAALKEAYETTQDGEFSRDGAGGFQARVTDREQIFADLAVFRSDWGKQSAAHLDAWYAGVETAYSELLENVGERERILLEQHSAGTLSGLRLSRSRELAKMTHMAESVMVRSRLSNIEKPDPNLGLDAFSEAKQMLSRIENEVAGGLERLRNNLETDAEDPSIADGNIDAERWRESFQEELDKGLALWDEAQQKLLLNRAAWEKRAGKDVEQGVKDWHKAFKDLKAAQVQWLTGFDAIRKRSEALWEDEKRNLSNALDLAKAEIAESILSREGSMLERSNVLVDMLGQSLNMMATARENFAYWLNRINPGSVLELGDVPHDAEGMWEIYNQEIDNYKIESQQAKDSRFYSKEKNSEQARYWLEEIYSDYKAYAEEARDELYDTYGITMFGRSGLDKNGIKGSPVNLEDGKWQDFFLDEYQVELLKAQATAKFRERERDVAKAVWDYAEANTDLSREEQKARREERENTYNSAFTAYNAALTDYESTLAALNSANAALTDNSEKIKAVKGTLSRLKEEFNAAQEAYQNQILLMELDSAEYFKEQLRDYYAQLLGLDGDYSPQAAEQTAEVLEAYLEAVGEQSGEGFLKKSADIALGLVLGDSANHTLSLKDLIVRHNAASNWQFDPDDLTTSGFRENFLDTVKAAWSLSVEDRIYRDIDYLVSQADLSASLDPDMQAQLQAEIHSISAEMLRRYRGELELRLSQLKLLTDENALNQLDWAGISNNFSQAEDSDEIPVKLDENAQNARAALITGRITRDKNTLTALQNEHNSYLTGDTTQHFSPAVPSDFSDEQAVLGWLYTRTYSAGTFAQRLSEDIDNLEVLETAVANLDDFDTLAEALRLLMPNNPLAARYVNNGSVFMFDGRDYGALYLAEEWSAFDRAVKAGQLWQTFASRSIAGREKTRKEAIAGLWAMLAGAGLADESSGDWQMRDAMRIWNERNFTDEVEVFDWLAEVKGTLRAFQSSASVPEALEEGLYRWQRQLEDYFLVKSRVLSGGLTEAQIEDKLGSLDGEQEALDAHYGLFEQLKSVSEPLAKLSYALLIDGTDTRSETMLISTLAGELAAGIAVAADLGADKTWNDALEYVLDVLELENADNEAGMKLTSYLGQAKTLALERIERLQGIATSTVAYERQTLIARLNSFSFEALEAWLILGLQNNTVDEQAVLHYLKRAVYEQKTANAQLAGFSLSTEGQAELNGFTTLLHTVRQYIPAKDGGLLDYLKDAGIAEDTARGVLGSVWDDDFFILPMNGVLSSDSEKNAWIAESIRGQQKYFNSIAMSYAEELGWSIQAALSVADEAMWQAGQKLTYAQRKLTLNPGAWRQYLSKEFMQLDKGERWSDENPDGNNAVPAAVLAVRETRDETDRVYSAEDAQTADILETYNLLLAETAVLSRSITAWEQEQFSHEAMNAYRAWAAPFNGNLSAMSTPNNLTALEDMSPLVMNPALVEALNQKQTAWQQRVNRAASMKSGIASFGRSVADYLASLEAAAGVQALKDARDVVAVVNGQIEAAEEEWKKLIGVAGSESHAPAAGSTDYTYREAEYLYSQAYKSAVEKSQALESAKLSYRKAKAIRDYTVSYHLYLGRDIAGDYHDLEPVLAVDLENSQSDIDAIRPERILAEAEDEYRRARGVIRVLEESYSNLPAALADTDSVYRNYLDKVESAGRDDIALERLGGMLAVYREKMLDEYEQAKEKREKALSELYSSRPYPAVNELEKAVGIIKDDFPIQRHYLQTLDINWDSNGRAIVTFDSSMTSLSSDTARNTRLAQFFGIENNTPPRSGSEVYGDLVHELLLAMSGLSEDQITQWFEAALYEMMHYSINVKISGSSYYAFMNVSYGKYPHQYSVNRAIDLSFKSHANKGYEYFKGSYDAIDKDDNYQFFKLAYIADLVQGTDFSFEEMGSNKAQEEAHTRTVNGMGGWDSIWFPEEIGRVKRARNNYGSAYVEQRDIFMGYVSQYKKLYDTETLYKSNFDTATGSGSHDFDELFEVLSLTLRQSPEYQTKEIADLLSINGTDYSSINWSGKLKQRFNTLKDVIPARTISQAQNLPQLLDILIQEAKARREAAEYDLDQHLYRETALPGESPGIAVQQTENMAEFTRAQEEFQAYGILPLSGYSIKDGEDKLAAWKRTGLKGERNMLADHIREHLITLEGRGAETYLLQENLKSVMDDYEGARDEEVFAKAVEMFGDLLSAYRAGKRYLEAAASAWNAPLYNARDALSDKWGQDKALFSRLNSGSSEMAALSASRQLPRLMEALKGTLDARMMAYQDVRHKEMDLLIKEGDRRYKTWQNQMTAMFSRGRIEWRLATIKMKREHIQWQTDFQQILQDGLEAWGLQYENFLTKKNQWVSELTEQAVHIGDENVLTRVGMSAQEAIAAAGRFIMPDLPVLPDLENFMGRVLNQTLLSTLLENAKGLEDGIGALEAKVFTDLGKNPYVTGEMLDKIRRFQTEENEELSARMALVQYERMLDTLDEAVEGLEEGVADANEDYAESIRRLLASKQFRRSGNNFIKNTLVMSTLWENIYEDHVIEGYNFYDANLPNLKEEAVPVSGALIEEFGSVGIQALLDRALKALEDEQVRVFGNGESVYVLQVDSSRSGIFLDKEDYVEQYAAWKKKSDGERKNSRYTKLREGEFNEHIGYASQFVDNPDAEISLLRWRENVRFEGSGEQERIYGLFMQHQYIEAYAESEMHKPFYERKLWDDRGAELKALTLRGAFDIGVMVVSSIVSAGMATGPALAVALVSTTINLTDDLLFTTLDISTGYRTPEQALGSFGKKALSSIASSAIGTIGMSTFEMGTVLTKTALTGVRALGSRVATSAINAVKFDGSGDFFDEDAFGKGINPGSVVASMMGSLVQFGLDDANLTDYLGKTLEHGKILNRSIGSGISTGLEIAFTGNSTLNILNFSDFFMFSKNDTGLLGKFGRTNVGLLEFRLRKNGPSLGIGSGGHSFGIGTIAASFRGLDAYRQNSRIRKANLETKLTAGMRSLYSARGLSEDDNTLRLTYEDILVGRAKVSMGDRKGYEGFTVTVDGVRYMDLNRADKSELDIAVLLAHEAYRDGIDVQDLKQIMETDRAVEGHMNVAEQIASTYGFESLNRQNAAEAFVYMRAKLTGSRGAVDRIKEGYDSSGDYWRLVKDKKGNFGWEDDGSLDFDVTAAMHEYLSQFGFGGLGFFKYTAEEMQNGKLGDIADIMFGRNADNPLSKRNVAAYAKKYNFEAGTRDFIDVGMTVRSFDLAGNKLTNTNLSDLNKALNKVQSNGLLIRKDFQLNASGLVNVGGDGRTVYAPVRHRVNADGSMQSPLMTSGPGYRIMPDGSGSNKYILTNHTAAVDLGGGLEGRDIVASTDNSGLSLVWNDTYGMRVLNGFGIENLQGEKETLTLYSSHADVEASVMNYISAFGTKGVTLNGNKLDGLPAGMPIGKVGNSGIGTGPHVDFKMMLGNGFVNPLDLEWTDEEFQNSYSGYFNNLEQTKWAEVYSNLGEQYNEAYKYINSEEYLKWMKEIDPSIYGWISNNG